MPGQASDRNLLFGILALQMDFISREALIEAMNAWALEKQRPLGEILVEKRALSQARRSMLETLVDEHVRVHHDDPAASLAALGSIGGIASDLRRSFAADSEVLASIATLSSSQVAEAFATRSLPRVQDAQTGLRFQKVRQHAAGNLGVVYVARDEELNREVALKEIKERNADRPHDQARFLLEAEVTGGLEHPGIVPVYGLGHYPDGRPYYAMRFIRGKSLLDAIRRFHADETLRSDPGRRHLALQKLLRRFTDVCNAVGYAHSRGILHRDLKPDNVMVGKYGETLVVDWGLAKALGVSSDPEMHLEDPDDPSPEGSLQPSSSNLFEATQAGSLVGTPAYMSPEQAAGRLDLLGPKSDIYGLGATLYHLIVGKAPIEGSNLGAILVRIRIGEIDRPRAHASWLDPALEAICLKAMALEPQDRYATPRALAEELDRWIAGEPVEAFPEPWTRRTQRWAKRHRTALTTIMTASIVAALLLGGVAWLSQIRRHRVDASALVALRKAEGLAIEARASGELVGWERAIAEASLAQDRAESGGSLSVRREVFKQLEAFRSEEAKRRAILEARAKDGKMVAALDEARLRGAIGPGGFNASVKHDAYLRAFQSYGIDVSSLPVAEAARRVQASPIADELLSALDDWSLDATTNVPLERLAEIAQAAESDPRFLAGRAAFARQDAAELRKICREEFHHDFGPRFRSFFGALKFLDPTGSLPLLEAIRREHSNDFWINEELGIAYFEAQPQRLAESVICLAVAAAIRPESSMAHSNLGIAQKLSGRPEEAIAAHRQAVRLDPNNSNSHFELGFLLFRSGDSPRAIAELREAIRTDPNNARAYSLLGSVLSEQGSFAEALTLIERGQELGAKLDDWPDPSGNRVKEIRQLRDLDARLPAILKGEASPTDADDRIRLADVCRRKGLRSAEARFYREAFASNPALAQDLVKGYRLGAARAACVAGSGRSQDDPKPDDSSRSRLRQESLAWLRADLSDLRQYLETSTEPTRKHSVAGLLTSWKLDPELRVIREQAELAKLPAAERDACQAFWAEVEALAQMLSAA